MNAHPAPEPQLRAVDVAPVLILAGGTGGHIFPGLAVATALRARNVPVVWLGADDGMETRLVPQHGIAIETIAISGLRGKGIGTLLRAPLRVLSAIRAAADVPTLQHVAADIRRFARNLLGQGVHARQLTELISHLNDVLTERLVTLIAAQRSIDLTRVCWLAFGSEGRSEQTIATDQDNGIVFASDDAALERTRLLAFARDVNEALDACGYPLCKGNVMASNPECCLTQAEWLARFASWIDHGAPEDLLNASIYFDARALAGAAALVTPMRELVSAQAGRNARQQKSVSSRKKK